MTLCHHIMTSYHMTAFDNILGKNTDNEGTSREGASTLRRFHFIYFYCNFLICFLVE